MLIFLVVGYILLFLWGLASNKNLAISLPIFTFCFPVKLPVLNYGLVSLYMIFIIFAFVKTYFCKVKLSSMMIRWKKMLISYVIIILILSSLISLLFDFSAIEINIKTIIEYLLILMVLLTYVNLCGCINKKYILSGLLLTGLLQSIIAIGLIFSFDNFGYFYDGKAFDLIGGIYYRATGTFKGPWDLGGFLALCIIFYISSYNEAKSKFSLILFFCTISTCFYALLLTQSRAGWVLLAIALFYLMFYYKLKILYWMIPLVILAIVLSSKIDLDLLKEGVLHRIVYTFSGDTGGLDASSEARIDNWNKIFINFDYMYLLTGYGINYAPTVFGITPHNTYLAVITYGGLIAFTFVVTWFKKLIILLGMIPKASRISVYAMLLGCSMYGLSADLLYTTKVMLILFIFITYKLSGDRNYL